MKGYILGVTALVLVLNGCASAPATRSTSRMVPQTSAIDKMIKNEVGDLDRSLAERIMTQPLKRKSRSRLVLEKEMNRKIWWWLRYYTVRERSLMTRGLQRGEEHRLMIQQVLGDHKLPPELYYLALIESSFVGKSKSSVGASGFWQLMPPTAKQYGLAVNGEVDERWHPVASTQAAAQYLAYLHNRFDSWYLAIAAYNAGQGRIAEAVKRGRTHNFWNLAERRMLPRETMDYIPKFIAAVTIGNHLEKFGFAEPGARQPWPDLALINVKKGKRLSTVAKLSKVSERDLIRLNPQFRHAPHGPVARATRVWVPERSLDPILERQVATMARKPWERRNKLGY